MENIVSASHNKGALPRDYEELQIMAGEPEEIETDEISDVPEVLDESETDKQDEQLVYTHVRAPEIRRSGTRILMGVTAVCGERYGRLRGSAGLGNHVHGKIRSHCA